jgi:hypothetical protein
MRDASSRRWLCWRVTIATPTSVTPVDRFGRIPVSAGLVRSAEQPAADGIRHELVARIRAEIAAGTYDTEERWLAAEEALFRRIEAMAR